MVDEYLVPWTRSMEMKKAKGLDEAVQLADFLIGQRKREIHKSLLLQAIQESDAPDLIWTSGADPPIIIQPSRQFQSGNEAGLN